MAVWSQLKMSWGGISFMRTSADISAKNSSLSSAKFDSVTFPALDAFHLMYPMRFINDLAQALVISMYVSPRLSQ